MPARLFAAAVILAHSWYPMECCEDSHCRPAPCDQMIEQKNGDIIFNGLITVPAARVRPSPDRRCHICVVAGSGVCAFIHYGT
jgi:hypothetical protein